ncbi:MAG: chitobiase/beta-hexosaminidase C-terminal domain-containing protein, partial [Paramuribaculum sp.]|nr:chitobiase/beta-hexosaminidase C-terminal domain-containing protein [Paramuribaculum sp.]
AVYYNVVGFAMIGDDGEIEIWPTEVEKVSTTNPIKAEISGNIISKRDYYAATGSYDMDVVFYPYTTVTLTPTGAGAVPTIYYWIARNDKEKVPATAMWNVYSQPFAVTRSCYIHVMATRSGYEESVHTHLDMTLGEQHQLISVKPIISHRLNEENSKYLITIKPEDESLAEGTYTIHYTTNGSTPTTASQAYTGEFEMPQTGGVILAILKEHAKMHPSSVAHLNISYIPTDIEGIDSDRNGSDVRAEGDSIIAPEGSEVYDINGRRVAATGLRSGIYIVKVPGAKAVKVKVD